METREVSWGLDTQGKRTGSDSGSCGVGEGAASRPGSELREAARSLAAPGLLATRGLGRGAHRRR